MVLISVFLCVQHTSLMSHFMGSYSGGLIIGRIFASEIWGT